MGPAQSCLASDFERLGLRWLPGRQAACQVSIQTSPKSLALVISQSEALLFPNSNPIAFLKKTRDLNKEDASPACPELVE